MALQALTNCLEQNQITYFTLQHPPAYSAQERAQAAHVSGYVMVKSVVVEIDGEFSLLVLHAADQIDLELLADVLMTDRIRIPDEGEILGLFPGCETGALPPFGNLFDLEVFVSEEVAWSQTVVFSAGTHREVILMDYKDFARLVRPRVVPMCSLH